MSEDNKINIPALVDFVRKHMVYKGEIPKLKQVSVASITDWLVDTKTQSGIHYVRGAFVYDDYKSWCIKNNREFVKSKTFHSNARNALHYNEQGTNLSYNINRKIKNESQSKAGQAEQGEEKSKKEE